MLEWGLRVRWARLGHPVALVDALLAKYGEPHRCYHTAAHLRHMFDVFDRDGLAREASARLSSTDRAALDLATWYHDREYRPMEPGNELRSALQFLADCSVPGMTPFSPSPGGGPHPWLPLVGHALGATPVNCSPGSGPHPRHPLVGLHGPDAEAVRSRVVQMILVSRHHRPPPGDGALALFCDLDLAILGDPPARYEVYRRQVRAEYACVSDAGWRQGRLAFLEGCLCRPHLFHVLLAREEQARRNLQAEWELLAE